MTRPPHIRRATARDASTLLTLIDALAEYEKLEPPDAAAKQRLIKDIGGEHPRFEAFLAEVEGRAVAYAIVFETYSSFLALPTFYLEDIFVLPEYRKMRIGYALFNAMVAEAHRRGCGRMEWSVLDWNRLAIDFYLKIGARHMKEWNLYRLTRTDMEKVLQNSAQPRAASS